jgi:hypothetical protein
MSTMRAAVRRNPQAFFLASALLILLTCVAIVRSQAFARNPDVAAWGVTFDLAVSIPLLYWFFVVRSGKARPLTVTPVFLIGTTIAALLIPRAQQDFLHQLGRVFGGAAELLLLIALTRRILAARKAGIASSDPYARIHFAARTLAGDGRIADFMASEVAMVIYALTGWWKRPEATPGRTITFHERNGWGAILVCIFVLLAAEGLGMHLLLGLWSAKAAWIWTLLDLWAALWLLGDYHALRLRRSYLDDDALHLRVGLRWSATIPRANIAAIEAIHDESQWKRKDVLKVAILDAPTWLVTLREPAEVSGLAGMTKTISALALLPDQDDALR